MKEKLNEMIGNWYGQRRDIIQELNEMGIDVWEENSEYITAGYVDKETDEDVGLLIRLGGTERTIVINSIEEM
ncbi:MAG: hypothetical protein IKL46_04750 [Clostridia bacterium]|nr:hypothetical protein [Clostridia bacterium]